MNQRKYHLSMNYINTSGYKFLNLTDLLSIQAELKSQSLALELKGTILISEEGINVCVCGSRTAIESFYTFLSPRFPDIDFKESISDHQPFKQMLIKIKPEIITFGQLGISPITNPAPNIAPETLKQWLDDGKEMLILDTRNDYEVQIGKFKNAMTLDIQNFRDFATAVEQLPENYKNMPIVTYCTGGIRCEKAAPFLMNVGFKEVYQLEGGILKYLKICGNAHYEGACFVFDKRIAVDCHLKEL